MISETRLHTVKENQWKSHSVMKNSEMIRTWGEVLSVSVWMHRKQWPEVIVSTSFPFFP